MPEAHCSLVILLVVLPHGFQIIYWAVHWGRSWRFTDKTCSFCLWGFLMNSGSFIHSFIPSLFTQTGT